MEQPMRVLLVERPRQDGGIAKHLLSNYDLDFGWASASSPQDLLKIAADFNPNIVLCCECTPAGAGHAQLDALRLLCSQVPIILVSSLREASTPCEQTITELFLDDLRPAAADATIGRVADAVPSPDDQDLVRLRGCFSSILESSTHPVVMSDSNGWITFANTSACHTLGGVDGRSLGTLIEEPADPLSAIPHWLDLARDANQGNDQYSGPFGVASLQISSRQRVHRLAYFDAGTGFPSPIHVNAIVDQVGGPAMASHSSLAMVATNLQSARIADEASSYSLGDDDPNWSDREDGPETPVYGSVVRITPHDFLVALPKPSSAAEAAFTAQRVLESIAASLEEVPRQLSIAATGVRPAMSASRAAIVDPQSTRRRLSRVHALTDVQPNQSEQTLLESNLADALKRHALSVQYQPQYELNTGRGCGVEALVRWMLSTGEMVPPSKFIPLAERSGIIQDLGAWVLQSACEASAGWCMRTVPMTTLSVNVSALQIDRQFSNVLAATLKRSGFPAQQLELEITESALIGDTELTIQCLKEWKQLGVRIAVDDFGTGYSSLSYLSRLPIDRLKLDQSLIRDMTQDPKGAAVTRSIISLGAELGIDVIAEGVETEQQFQMLTKLGCPRVQGYLLGRPMSAKQAQLVLRKTWGNRPAAAYPAFRPADIAVEPCHVH